MWKRAVGKQRKQLFNWEGSCQILPDQDNIKGKYYMQLQSRKIRWEPVDTVK